MSQRENTEWLSVLEARDEEAVAELHTYLRRALRRALSKHDVDDHSLDDYAQEGTLRVLERLDRFGGHSRFTTWASSVAIRVGLTDLRRKRAPQAPLSELIPERRAEAHPSQRTERGELLDSLREAIDRVLSDRQRTVVLGELAGLPAAEVAARLNATPNAIYKAYHDARKKLRHALEGAGFSASDVYAQEGGSRRA